MGSLTTHVLDVARGCPAANVTIQLWYIEDKGYRGQENIHIKTVHTNVDGRTDTPIIEGDEFVAGVYELHFAIGAYFVAQRASTPELPFLDIVPIRFGIADPTAHYHVPLLVSPWAYSTYRGS